MKLSTIILSTAMIGMASAESYLLFDASSRPGKSFKAKAVSKSSKRVGRNKALSESKSSKVSKCYDPYRGRFSVEQDELFEEDLLIGGIEEGPLSLSQSMSLSMSASLSLSFTTPIGKSGKSGDRGWSAEGKAGKSGRGKALKGLDCDCLTTSSGKSSKSGYGKSGKSGSYGKSGKSRRVLDYIPPTSSSKSGKSGSKTVKSKYSGRAPTCPPPRRTTRPVLVGITLVVASDDVISVLSTSPPVEIDVLVNDVGIGGSLIVSSVSLTSSPDSGTCAVNSGTTVVYTPPTNPLFVGEATCTYEACLVGALEPSCDDAVITITVLPEVDATDDVVDGVLTTSAGESIDVLLNDVTSPAGLPLNVTAITSPPSVGVIVISDDMKEVIYTPPTSPLFVGDVTFEYEACTHEGSCDRANVTVSVVPEVNANDDNVGAILSTSAGETIDVLANDVTLPGGLGLNITTITSPPTFGSVVISDDMKEVIYTPPSSPLFVGDVTFEYEACTDSGSCDTAVVTLTPEPMVVAVDDSYTVLPPISQSLGVLQNDVTTPAGHSLIVNSITTPPLSGTATIAVDNSAILYTPPSDSFIGETFEYEACFDNGAGASQCDIAMVTISVDPVFIDQTDTPTLMPSDAPTSQVPTSQPLDPSEAPTTSLPTFTPSLQPTTESPTEVSSP